MKGELLELHRRISLRIIDVLVTQRHRPGDYWVGLYNAKSTLHVRPQAGRARLSAHGRARGLVKMDGSGHAPDVENVGIWAFPCAGIRKNVWIRTPPSGHSRARGLAKVHGSGHGSNVKMLRLKELQ